MGGRQPVPLYDSDGKLEGYLGTCLDVTDRIEAEKELEASARFFDIAGDLLCTASFDGAFRRLNGAWDTLGWSLEELRSRPFVEFVHPEDRERTAAHTAKLGEGRRTVSFRNRYAKKDGDYCWLEWTAVGVPDDGLIYAAARDVTGRVEVEQALRTSEERSRTLIDNLPGSSITVVDPDLRIQFAGGDAYGQPGREPERVLGSRLTDLVDDPEQRAQLEAAYSAALAGETVSLEYHSHSNDITYWLQIVPLRDEAGDVEAALSVGQDVTEPGGAEGAGAVGREGAPKLPKAGSIQSGDQVAGMYGASEGGGVRGAVDAQALSRLRDEVGGADVLRSIVEIFLRNAPEQAAEVSEAVRRGDAEATGKAAHKLKGERPPSAPLRWRRRRGRSWRRGARGTSPTRRSCCTRSIGRWRPRRRRSSGSWRRSERPRPAGSLAAFRAAPLPSPSRPSPRVCLKRLLRLGREDFRKLPTFRFPQRRFAQSCDSKGRSAQAALPHLKRPDAAVAEPLVERRAQLRGDQRRRLETMLAAVPERGARRPLASPRPRASGSVATRTMWRSPSRSRCPGTRPDGRPRAT